MRWCVFCGSSAGTNPVYRAAALELGTALAAANIELVYGGGHVGLMGAVADAVLAAGGTVIGVIPRALAEREVAHSGLTQLHVVESMHERKALMADLSDGFVALPGGFGTFEEFCEAVTWVQLGIQAKPCVLLDVNGYYEPLIAMFDRAVEDGFVNMRNRLIIQVTRTISEFMSSITR
jgi:uncharacterized protein (TIGR00730 family)